MKIRTITYDENSIIDPKLTDWYVFCQQYKLTEKFIEKWKEYVNWDQVSRFQVLSEKFINNYKSYVNWWYITKKQKLSSKFLDDNFDLLYSKIKQKYKFSYLIENIIKHQKLEEWFIDKYFDKLVKSNYKYVFDISSNMNDIIQYQKHLKYDYLVTLIKRDMNATDFKKYISQLIYYSKIPINNLEILLDKYSDDRREIMKLICRYQKLSEEFMKKHDNEIDFDIVSAHQKFSVKFYSHYKNKLDEDRMVYNTKLKWFNKEK